MVQMLESHFVVALVVSADGLLVRDDGGGGVGGQRAGHGVALDAGHGVELEVRPGGVDLGGRGEVDEGVLRRRGRRGFVLVSKTSSPVDKVLAVCGCRARSHLEEREEEKM